MLTAETRSRGRRSRDEPDRHIYPLESIESPETRAAMREADLIFGFDISREKDVLMYGRDALKAIVESRKPTALRIVRIKYDQRTGNSLEYLVAAVRAVKGHDAYNRVD